MKDIPTLTGLRLDEGLTILGQDFESLNVIIKEYTIPDDFYKKNIVNSGIKRIVRQKTTANGNLELTICSFNEIPQSLL
ncbi:MAG: hypothetical protein GX160_04920 [Clostridiales bacterium]|nr:hypothetical protein [Clostridiales bacterium]